MKLLHYHESVDQVEIAFYKAIDMGDYALMETLYADQGVSCMHPDRPTIIDRQKVLDYWELCLKDIPRTFIERKILSISKSPFFEARHVIERFQLNDTPSETSEIFTTSIYIFQENGWKIQMQHSSSINSDVTSFKN